MLSKRQIYNRVYYQQKKRRTGEIGKMVLTAFAYFPNVLKSYVQCTKLFNTFYTIAFTLSAE